MLKYRLSTFAHGINKTQIEEALANRWHMSKWFQIHDDKKGNAQDMVIGFDYEGMLIEIGITYLADDEIVFHASKATKYWVENLMGSNKWLN